MKIVADRDSESAVSGRKQGTRDGTFAPPPCSHQVFHRLAKRFLPEMVTRKAGDDRVSPQRVAAALGVHRDTILRRKRAKQIEACILSWA